jgi:phytanoyl-CoA hydroxylase
VLDGVANRGAEHRQLAAFHIPDASDGIYIERVLSSAEVDRYRRDGFLVLEGFAPAEACAALRRRAVAIVDGWEPTAERTIFTTDQQERSSNREFLASGGSIWCFFEEGAFDAAGELVQDKALSINKIGHAMHDLDPVFESFSYTPELAAVASDIGMAAPLAIQSMYIFKQPHIGGEVGCHQDATFLYTEPLTVTGFWFAIEDATVENGCLWAQPGGHRGPLRQRFERVGTDDDGTTFVALDDTPLPTPPDQLVPIEAAAGTLVVLDGLLPHWSDVNRSPVSRHAYSLHCIDGTARYPETNWLQRPASMPPRSLLEGPGGAPESTVAGAIH